MMSFLSDFIFVSNAGCPISTQPWCADQPALGIPEFVIGYFLGVIGYVNWSIVLRMILCLIDDYLIKNLVIQLE